MNLAMNRQTWGETFSMPVLAFRFSEYANGVSELHGEVARKMWHFLWPDRAGEDVPITHVTNGVHMGTWLARRFQESFYLDPCRNWPTFFITWRSGRSGQYPHGELWNCLPYRGMVAHIQERARQQWVRESNT